MMKRFFLLMLTLTLSSSFMFAQRLQQKMGRGVVAVNRSGSSIRSVTSTGGQGNLISWRKLAQEPEGTTYNVYRRTVGTASWTKVNSTPLKKAAIYLFFIKDDPFCIVSVILNQAECVSQNFSNSSTGIGLEKK